MITRLQVSLYKRKCVQPKLVLGVLGLCVNVRIPNEDDIRQPIPALRGKSAYSFANRLEAALLRCSCAPITKHIVKPPTPSTTAQICLPAKLSMEHTFIKNHHINPM